MSNAIKYRIKIKDYHTSITNKHSFAFGTNLIHNEDNSIWLAFDGEIYNHKELRAELKKNGHNFNTQKAGEEIIHLYEDSQACPVANCYGTRLTEILDISKLNGNFAFVLWDSKKEQVLLARDNFGIKPLYYWFNDSKLLFATEIKALLTDDSIEKAPNDAIIYDFLVTGVHEHTEDTFFKGIKKVMPAEYIIINTCNEPCGEHSRNACSECNRAIGHHLNITSKRRYWELKENPNIIKNKPKTIIDDFYNLFEDAVRIRALGNFGAMLSGGLDSSSVVGMLCKLRRDTTWHVPTFSSYHIDHYLDERKYISAVVNKWGLENKHIAPESKQLWQEFKNFIWHQEEPIRGSSTWDHFNLLRFVNDNGFKFLFDGQGGDETLYGYTGYFPMFLIELWHKGQLYQSLKETICGANILQTTVKDKIIGYMSPQAILHFLNSAFVYEFKKHENKILQELFPATLKEKSFYAITKYSLAFLLKETERNAGAFGIELRIPFLDPRLVEYSFSLPVEYKIRNGWNKWILREIGKELLPALVRNRRRKIGFGTPETRWTRELNKGIKKLFEEDRQIYDYIDRERLLKSFEDFCKGKAIQPDFFWRVISLEFWLREFMGK